MSTEPAWHQHVSDESWRETNITTTADDYSQSRRWIVRVDDTGALVVIEET